MTALDVYEFVSAGGLPAVLLLIVWTGYKRVWVWGRDHDEQIARAEARAERAEARAERYERLAERTTPALIRFTQAADRILGKEAGRE
jgi:hypothetical protein